MWFLALHRVANREHQLGVLELTYDATAPPAGVADATDGRDLFWAPIRGPVRRQGTIVDSVAPRAGTPTASGPRRAAPQWTRRGPRVVRCRARWRPRADPHGYPFGDSRGCPFFSCSHLHSSPWPCSLPAAWH